MLRMNPRGVVAHLGDRFAILRCVGLIDVSFPMRLLSIHEHSIRQRPRPPRLISCTLPFSRALFGMSSLVQPRKGFHLPPSHRANDRRQVIWGRGDAGIDVPPTRGPYRCPRRVWKAASRENLLDIGGDEVSQLFTFAVAQSGDCLSGSATFSIPRTLKTVTPSSPVIW